MKSLFITQLQGFPIWLLKWYYVLKQLADQPGYEIETFMTFYKWFSQVTQFSVTQHKSSNIKSHNNTTFLFSDEVAVSFRLGIFWFIYCWLFHALGSSLSFCGFPNHVLVLSDRAMIKQARIDEHATRAYKILLHAGPLPCWYNTQMGTGRLWFGVFYIFLFLLFVCFVFT